jgi:hypothetical protein
MTEDITDTIITTTIITVLDCEALFLSFSFSFSFSHFPSSFLLFFLMGTVNQG